jgi:hypothetical protein
MRVMMTLMSMCNPFCRYGVETVNRASFEKFPQARRQNIS